MAEEGCGWEFLECKGLRDLAGRGRLRASEGENLRPSLSRQETKSWELDRDCLALRSQRAACWTMLVRKRRTCRRGAAREDLGRW